MTRLEYRLMKLVRDRSGGSHLTRRAREYTLRQAARQLTEANFRFETPKGLKPRHVDHLLEVWDREVGVATMQNRMAHLRWWAETVGKRGMVPSNRELSLGRRDRVTNTDRSRALDAGKLAAVRDPYVAMSLRLQREFGLRREEAIKFAPKFAVRGDRIVLKASWTKGGRPREIAIRTAAQRAVLREAGRLARDGALIAPGRNYAEQRNAYVNSCRKAGFDAMHGLRHAWAQDRYRELTGMRCPVLGGPSRRNLEGDAARRDAEARRRIAEELGHGRTSITDVYLGR